MNDDSVALGSLHERDRRYRLLRESMVESGLDALVVASQGDGTSHARVNYLAKYVYQGSVVMVVMPLDGSPILITDPLPVWPSGDWIGEDDTRAVTCVGREVGEVLVELGLSNGRIGLVSRDDVRESDYRAIAEAVPDAHLVDAREVFERVSLIKSGAEFEAYRSTALIAKRAVKALEASLSPGRSERDVVAEAHRLLRLFGCGPSVIAIAKRPFATRGRLRSSGFRAPTDQTIVRQDVVVFEFDVTGPDGYGVEFRRVYSFEPLDEPSTQFLAWREEVFEACMKVMRPGVNIQQVDQVVRSMSVAKGYEDTRLSPQWHVHGLGLGLEPPFVPGPDLTLRAGMVMVLHPILRLGAKEMATVGDLGPSDSVLITDTGCERLVDPVDSMCVVLSP
nr:M24 family metallopeptidase [Nocardioides agariphilus]